MKVLLFTSVLLVGCALVAPPEPAEKPLGPGEIASARAAEGALAPGRSTKAEVLAALGPGTVVDFASGYEVWLYRQPPREKPPAPGAELVLLFSPDGILSKTRVR